MPEMDGSLNHSESRHWPDNTYGDYAYDQCYKPLAGLTSSNLMKFQQMVDSTNAPRGRPGAPPECIDIKGGVASDTSSVTAPDTTDHLDDINLVALTQMHLEPDIGMHIVPLHIISSHNMWNFRLSWWVSKLVHRPPHQ